MNIEPLKIAGSDHSPEVSFNPAELLFSISGESRPEDVKKFFEPIQNWLEKFSREIISGDMMPKIEIRFDMKFDYFNSSSAKHLMDIVIRLDSLQKASPTKVDFKFFWHSSDDEILEAGEELSQITKVNFEFISY